jgi:hypothetical protein
MTKHDMSEAEKAAKLADALKLAAQRAGMVDLDGLKLLSDTSKSKVTLEESPYGTTVKGADEVIHSLRERWPDLFVKKMKDRSSEEQATWWAEHKKKFPDGRLRPGPLDVSKKAKAMSEDERRKFLDECKRHEW